MRYMHEEAFQTKPNGDPVFRYYSDTCKRNFLSRRYVGIKSALTVNSNSALCYLSPCLSVSLFVFQFLVFVVDNLVILPAYYWVFLMILVLFILLQAKLKESQYQLAPWRSDVNQSNFSPSPSHSSGVGLIIHFFLLSFLLSLHSMFKLNSHISCLSQIKNGLELVAQSQYSNQKMPLSSEPHASTDWDLVGHHPSGLSSSDVKNAESDDLGRYPPLASRWAWSNGDCYCELNVQFQPSAFCWWVLVSLNFSLIWLT